MPAECWNFRFHAQAMRADSAAAQLVLELLEQLLKITPHKAEAPEQRALVVDPQKCH
jgi:hypothetical protein